MLAIKRKFNYTYDAHILKQEQLNKDKLFFAHYTYIVSFYMAIKLYNIYLNDKDKAFEIYEITRKKPEEDFGFYQDLMNIPNFDLFLKKSVLDLRNHLLNDSSNKIRKR